MLRLTSRLCRLTFESLLCGSHPELPPPPQLAAVATQAAAQFTTQCSTSGSSTPQPIALAATTVASHLLQNKLREAAGFLSAHPQQSAVLRTVRDYVGRYPADFTLQTLREMSEEAKFVSVAAVTTFLQATAQQFLSTAPAESAADVAGREADDAQLKWAAQREELRGLLVRHTQFHPTAAAALLRAICLLSDTTAAAREDVMAVMSSAMQQQQLNPADFGYVLEVLQRCGEPRRVAQVWGWVQQTSACWDCRAASAAVVAFAQLGRLDEAVTCMQHLAEAGVDPSTEAQVAFIRFLGTRSPPLPQYAEQLVHHWYPSPDALWRGAGQDVGLELLQLRSVCGLHDQAVELLKAACAATANAPEEQRRFLQHPAAAVVARRYAARIAESATLQQFFLGSVLRTPTLLSDRPDLVGAVLCLGMAAGRLPEVYGMLEKVPLSAETFLSALNFFARRGASKTAQAGEMLACMEEAALKTGNVVPPELKAWLQLAKEM